MSGDIYEEIRNVVTARLRLVSPENQPIPQERAAVRTSMLTKFRPHTDHRAGGSSHGIEQYQFTPTKGQSLAFDSCFVILLSSLSFWIIR
jgi:hypothetical protein